MQRDDERGNACADSPVAALENPERFGWRIHWLRLLLAEIKLALPIVGRCRREPQQVAAMGTRCIGRGIGRWFEPNAMPADWALVGIAFRSSGRGEHGLIMAGRPVKSNEARVTRPTFL